MHNTYIQGELAEWSPIAGTTDFVGSALKYFLSVNHALLKPSDNLQLIGTLEFGGISFQAGRFTNPLLATGAPNPNPDGTTFTNARTSSYFSIGPGFRLFYCQKFDVGIGMQFNVTTFNIADQLYRTEVRWRF